MKKGINPQKEFIPSGLGEPLFRIFIFYRKNLKETLK